MQKTVRSSTRVNTTRNYKQKGNCPFSFLMNTDLCCSNAEQLNKKNREICSRKEGKKDRMRIEIGARLFVYFISSWANEPGQ